MLLDQARAGASFRRGLYFGGSRDESAVPGFGSRLAPDHITIHESAREQSLPGRQLWDGLRCADLWHLDCPRRSVVPRRCYASCTGTAETVPRPGGRSVSGMGESENPDCAVVVDRRADGAEPGGKSSPVILSDDAVVLRPWSSSDAIFMAEASRDPAIERYNGPVPASVADAITVIERIEQSWRTFEVEGDPTGAAFAIVDAASGEPVGMCGIDHWSSTDVAQFGYWLAAGARGQGLATRAVTLMTTWLFKLGAARVFLTIQSENASSAAVALRAGFSYEGTLRADGVWQGQRKDVDVFAVLADEWPLGRTR